MCVCVVGVDWVNVNVAAAEMLFWHVFLYLLCIESRLQDVGATFSFTELSEWVFFRRVFI